MFVYHDVYKLSHCFWCVPIWICLTTFILLYLNVGAICMAVHMWAALFKFCGKKGVYFLGQEEYSHLLPFKIHMCTQSPEK